MPVFNYPKKEVNVKVVYYGPGLSGKTTNLQKIHDGIKPDHRGKLVSLATQTDRTLFFDFMPLELGSIGGYKVRLHLYTVPGQVHYNATRKLVLKGVDGVVFVADSQKAMKDANVESILNLEKNLQSYGKSLVELPHIIQANKRDLGDVISLEEVNSLLNHHGALVTEAVASEGTGVLETLTEIVRLVMRGLRDQFASEAEEQPEPPSARVSAEAAGTGVQKTGDRPEPSPTPDPKSGQVPSHAEDVIEERPPAPGPEPEAAAAPPPGKASTSASTPVQTGEDEDAADVGTADTPEPEPEPVPPVPSVPSGGIEEQHPPVTVTVPVEGLGTVELTVQVSARLLEGGEAPKVEVNVSAASLEGAAREPEAAGYTDTGPALTAQSPPGGGIESKAPAPEPAPEIVPENEPLEVHEEPVEPLPLDRDLPPLEDSHDEPLGAPLDGQEPDDLRIPDLPQKEKPPLEEGQRAAEPEAPAPEPASDYDPTVQPLDFDFPETEPEEEPSRKKGFWERFKKK